MLESHRYIYIYVAAILSQYVEHTDLILDICKNFATRPSQDFTKEKLCAKINMNVILSYCFRGELFSLLC